nr:uncharacterized protein LOC116776465 [Danaus plexippus plexippus]
MTVPSGLSFGRFWVGSRHTQELHVTEMKMLRWMCDVMRADRIRNTFIRGSLGVREVADKLQESRLRWYGHVARRPENYVGKICLDMSVSGTRSPGRSRKRWLDTVKQGMRANEPARMPKTVQRGGV